MTHKTCLHPSAPPGFDFRSTWLVYMHVTELHVCKCTTWYSKRFFVINTTLTCITQMIIWLCENACIYALGVQRVKKPSVTNHHIAQCYPNHSVNACLLNLKNWLNRGMNPILQHLQELSLCELAFVLYHFTII